MGEFVPENLFNLAAFEKVCDAKKFVPTATFDVELFLNRHDAIIHVADDNGETYPFDVELSGELEFCGTDGDFQVFKIHFSAQKNDLIFFVGQDNLISKIAANADVDNPASIESFAGILVIILRNVGLNVEEIQVVNALIQNSADYVFNLCAETERFIFVNAEEKDSVCYFGFFAAV